MANKKTEAQRKAEGKFKKLSSSFNEADTAGIDERIIELNMNRSQYVRWLVTNDLSTSEQLEQLKEGNEPPKPQKDAQELQNVKDELAKSKMMNGRLAKELQELREKPKSRGIMGFLK